MSRQQWHAYVSSLDLGQSFPGIQGMGYSMLIDPVIRIEHEASIRNQGHPDYAIRPAGERSIYSSIIYLEPFDWRNQRAFGYDMFAEPVRRKAMEMARDSGQPAASGMVTLVQETEQAPQRGFLIYVPVYRVGSEADDTVGRRASIQGFVYAPFRMGDLMRGILGEAIGFEPDLHFQVYDGDVVDGRQAMYTSAEDGCTLDRRLGGMVRDTRVLLPGGQHWTVRYQAHASFIDTGAAAQPLLVAMGGLVIDLLLFLGIADLAQRQRRSRDAERRLAEELTQQRLALQASEQRLSCALTGVGDGVWDWHVPSGRVSFSDGWKAMLGHEPEEIGHGLDEWSRRVHPDDLARSKADIEDHLAGRTSYYRNEHRMRHVDGSWVWILDRGLVIERDAQGHAVRIVGTHTDITARKHLEDEQARTFELLEAKVRERTAHLEQANRDLADRGKELRIFAAAIGQSPLGVILTNEARQITFANGAAERLLGRTLATLQGLDLLASLQDMMPDGAADQAKTALAGSGHWSSQGELIGGTAASRWLEFQIAPITGLDGDRIGSACILRDLTQMKHLEIAHQQRMAELMQAAKMAALGTLTAGIGHEIGNPANIIAINAPLLKAYCQEVAPLLDQHAQHHPGFTVGRQPWPKIREVVPDLFAGIESGVARIRRLLGDLRQFTVPDPGDPGPVDVNAVVSTAVSLTRHAIDRATTHCQLTLDPARPLVRGSFQRLEQALVNLILNACQALPGLEYGITISTQNDASHGVLVTITDEGVGISAADLRHLGEPFHTTRREHGGTGLGLSIVRRIIADHGGTIRFASRPGHGTTVTIALPATTAQDGMPA
ncbi:MAG TPA: hypothetical protein DCS97_00360 [Planctomycetes bacterium]|nr:hypothetical protein [Planctomycetota bacterium]